MIKAYSKRYNGNRASALVQYALLIGVVSLALAGMQLYFKRGLQAKVKELTDSYIGSQQAQGDAQAKAIKSSSSYSSSSGESTKESFSGGAKRIRESHTTKSQTYTTRDDTVDLDKPYVGE